MSDNSGIMLKLDMGKEKSFTATEYAVLIGKPNSFVYVITDVLLDPTLHIIKGRSLISPKKDMRYEYADWIEIEDRVIKILGLVTNKNELKQG